MSEIPVWNDKAHRKEISVFEKEIWNAAIEAAAKYMDGNGWPDAIEIRRLKK